MTGPIRSGLGAVALCIAIAGCEDPYGGDHAQTTSTPAPRTGVPGDVDKPGPPAPAVPASAGSVTSLRGSARLFATRWVNWDWRSVAAQQRTLAGLATGGLARQLRANADSARVDATVARDRPGSRGRVAAIDLQADGDRARGIVVTREQTYTNARAELGGRRYRVYLVALRRTSDRWEVSAWQPQP